MSKELREVVLCKNCKYRFNPHCSMSYLGEDSYGDLTTFFILDEDDDFCPYGEEE